MTRDTRPKYAKIRYDKRADYDEAAVNAILDSALYGHLSFIQEGKPIVVPLAFARDGQTLYLHGASKTRFVKLCQEAAPLTFIVTHMDGLVVARSGFHHSVNYRTAIVHGTARAIEDEAERLHALHAVTEHLLPGRYSEVREDTAQELKATGVIALEIEYGAAKSRSGMPGDDEEDLLQPQWGGVIPIRQVLGAPLADSHTPQGMAEPASLAKALAKFGA
jgi:uncharacterized protein